MADGIDALVLAVEMSIGNPPPEAADAYRQIADPDPGFAPRPGVGVGSGAWIGT